MIKVLIDGLLNLFSIVITVILTPINLALNTLVPDLTNAIAIVNSFWSLLETYGKFCISYTGMTSTTMSIIIVLIYANLIIPWTVHGLKLVAKWWEVLV